MSRKTSGKPPIVFIVGPTATGKTDVAAHLAESFPAEVISCDSMQAYRGMTVLSQAPSPELRARVRHHLVEFLEPTEEYNAAMFIEQAAFQIGRIRAGGGMPVVAGGTGLYFKSLLDGLFVGPAKDEALRRTLEEEAEREGVAALYARLEREDAEAAAKIHSNDLRRIIRAFEVIRLTGRKFSELKLERKGLWDLMSDEIRVYGLALERPALYKRIDARVDRMLEEGAAEEVKNLSQKKLSMTAGMCLGLREIASFLSGEATREAAVELMKMNTRRYAKRQVSWFKRDPRVKWIAAGEGPASVMRAILKDLKA